MTLKLAETFARLTSEIEGLTYAARMIPDPRDFIREREKLPDPLIREIMGQFGFQAFQKNMNMK